MVKSIFAFFVVCIIVNSVISQNPDWLVPIGNTTNKEYFISTEDGPKRDFAEAKYECFKYNMTLAAIESGELAAIDDYLQSTYGANNETEMFWTSARMSPDFSQEVRWTTTDKLVGPDVPFLFRGPMPGESSYLWYECPPLIRSCVIGDSCDGSTPGCCGWRTRLIHSVGAYANSNCLEKRRFICHRSL